MRHLARVAVVAAWLIAFSQGPARADETFRWRVDHFDTLTNSSQTTHFETEREALAFKQKWEKVQNLSKGGPAYVNWKITKERKPAKPAADKAKETKDGEKKGGDLLTRLREAKDAADRGLSSGQTDLARTIADYKQSIEDAYRRIREFEKTLLGGTQEMQEKRFREINSLVDRYNRRVADFQSVMGPTTPLGYKPLAQFEAPRPNDEKPATPAAQFKLYTIQDIGMSGNWSAAATYDSLEAAKAAGDRYLFAAHEQRCWAVVDLRDATMQIGDRPSKGDMHGAAVLMRCKPQGGTWTTPAYNPRKQ